MARNIPVLTWTDQTDAAQPLAVYTVAFTAADPTWNFGLLGSYHQQEIRPLGFTVDNSINTVAVTVTIGSFVGSVPAFQVVVFRLPRNPTLVSLACSGVQTVGVEFWLVAPSDDQVSAYALQQQANL